MHSKVIIASLVCMMAATFGGNRIGISDKTIQPKTDNSGYCEAPNESNFEVELYNTTPYQGGDFCAFVRGIDYQSGMEQALRVIANPSNLSTYIGYHPAYGHYFNVAQPTTDGDHYATMGAYGKEIATIYIHRKNGVSYGSVLSKNDAREKCFFDTDSSANIVRQAATQFQASNSAFTAVKNYTNFVYGSNDISTAMNVVSRPSGEANNGTTLKFKVVWQAENKTYPAKNIPFHVAVRGYELTPSVEKKTNANGEYSVLLNSSTTSGLKLNEIGYAMNTNTAVTEVLSNSDMNYPYYGKYSLDWSVSSYKTINFNITVYPNRSDRAAAYEITQAHQLLGGYARDYTKRTLSKIVTEYPSYSTAYSSNGRGGSPVITVRKVHYHSWDALNHEFSHYICDDANLCYMPSNYESKPHRYNEDLSSEFGTQSGAKIAYAEGLATFITVAGQVKNAIYSSNSYVNVIAGYNYFDPINGVNVDYSLNKYGEPNSAHGPAVEASVTSIMVRLLTECYNVSESSIWRAIINAGNDVCTISRFVTELIELCPNAIADIYRILESENVEETYEYEPLSGLGTSDAWTLMLYMCGSTNLVDQLCEELEDICNVPGQPSNVNILVLVGGHASGPIYYKGNKVIVDSRFGYYARVVNNELIYVQNTFTRYDMGDPDTLEDFINWGIDNYPARKMGLVFFNHGRALEGVCFDAYSDDSLSNHEISSVMENIYADHSNLRGKFEFVGYDACLMQVQDVADFNSNYFNYMVASEEYTYGWEWTGFIEDIYNRRDTVQALTTLCNDFIPKNDEIYIEKNEERKACLSVLDLSKMKAYRSKLESLALNIKDTVDNHRDEFLNVINQSWHFANVVNLVDSSQSENKYEKYGTIDGYDFLTKLAASSSFRQYSSQINSVKAAYSSVVIVNRKALSSIRSNGLAMHVCLHEYPNQTYDVRDTKFQNWRNLFCIDARHYTYSFVTQNLHVKVCDCGYYEIEEHKIDNEWWENGHHYGHCSVCNSTFMYQ